MQTHQSEPPVRPLLDLIIFDQVDEMAVSVIAANLQAVAGLNTGILPPIESPDYAYVPVRNQFDATRIIKQLAFFSDGAPFKLGIIAHDICSPILSFVYGESQLGGKAALVSLNRLFDNNPETFYQRAAKISLHEAGHLLGLGHCWESFCIMHFSSNLEALDSLPISFCTACEYEIKRHLRTVVADEK
ncbi:MAG: zinc metallopeptidase [Deltaproteobacteria bacterium]|nr:zinc metallopeptidase [Deltaproteobacteria bacterium]